MLSVLNKTRLIQQFQMHQTVDYHHEALQRLSHLKADNLRKAAVLIGFVERESGLKVIFTKRAEHLKHHPGQISFPGGKFEELDSDLAETAIRETLEEVGIERDKISIFGQMPELPTISRFTVTPFLAFVSPDYQVNIDPNEVAEVFEVPIETVLDIKKLHSHTFHFGDVPHRIFGLTHEQHFIWGMTAQIIQAMQNHIMHSS